MLPLRTTKSTIIYKKSSVVYLLETTLQSYREQMTPNKLL